MCRHSRPFEAQTGGCQLANRFAVYFEDWKEGLMAFKDDKILFQRSQSWIKHLSNKDSPVLLGIYSFLCASGHSLVGSHRRTMYSPY